MPSLEIIQFFNNIQLGGRIPNPNYVFFLAGASRGHVIQTILLWFLPLYYLLLISEDAIQDYKNGYKNILISKIGKRKYCLEKMYSSFIVSFFIMFISLIFNLLLLNLVFKGGTYFKFEGVELPNNILFVISTKHPVLADIGFTLIASILAGFSGMLGSAFAIFFHDKKYTYPATFFVWILLTIREKSLMLVFQPFAEYDFNILIPIFLMAIALFIIISVAIYIYEVHYAEI
jgi:hypothetical protein